jgi:hypothetical protein
VTFGPGQGRLEGLATAYGILTGEPATAVKRRFAHARGIG